MLEKIPLQTIPIGKKDPAWMLEYKAAVYKQGSKVLPFRLLEPTQLTVTGKYPLVIWLHGVKGRGEDNQKQLTAGNSHGPAFFASEVVQKEHPAYVLVPQCPDGKFWINFTNNRIRRPLKLVVALVEQLLETLPIDRDSIYIGGQSMGAFATWALLAEHPKLFAAGIPVSGGGSTRKAKRSIQAPVWIFHGANDPIVRVIRSREMAEVLQAAGKKVTYTEFPNGRHDIWPQVFHEPNFAEWVFANRLEGARRRR